MHPSCFKGKHPLYHRCADVWHLLFYPVKTWLFPLITFFFFYTTDNAAASLALSHQSWIWNASHSAAGFVLKKWKCPSSIMLISHIIKCTRSFNYTFTHRVTWWMSGWTSILLEKQNKISITNTDVVLCHVILSVNSKGFCLYISSSPVSTPPPLSLCFHPKLHCTALPGALMGIVGNFMPPT